MMPEMGGRRGGIARRPGGYLQNKAKQKQTKQTPQMKVTEHWLHSVQVLVLRLVRATEISPFVQISLTQREHKSLDLLLNSNYGTPVTFTVLNKIQLS